MHVPISRLDHFTTIRIPMNMQIGPGCKPCVAKGDRVLVGQMIGEPIAAMSVPIHSSVSGTVQSVKREIRSDGATMDVVEINSDGLFEVADTVKPPQVVDKASFLEAVRASGMIGLGGAGFPTHIKLNPPPDKHLDLLIVNAVECEPYLTTDARICTEKPTSIVRGIRAVMKWLEIPRAVIAMEGNNVEPQNALRAALAEKQKETGGHGIDMKILETRYPQGAEKVLIREISGRIVLEGGLPADVGVLVMNVATVQAIDEFLETGMPLVRRNITLAGSAIKTPGNYNVPIGASLGDIIEDAGSLNFEPAKVVMGGPMMGVAVDSLDAMILKNNNAILAVNEKQASIPQESACIHCGRCVRACPMFLMPLEIDMAARRKELDTLQETHAMNCIECGNCNYVCPAKRYLTQNIRIGKGYIQQAKREGRI